MDTAQADEIHVKYADGVKVYALRHFVKNNDDRCYNQKVRVARGDTVKQGDILVEGASIAEGEIALGRNLTVAFMPWSGYNTATCARRARRAFPRKRRPSVGNRAILCST